METPGRRVTLRAYVQPAEAGGLEMDQGMGMLRQPAPRLPRRSKL